MKRLMVGDTFHPMNRTDNPYTVTGVMKDGYMVKQENDEVEEYAIKVIHDLFEINDTPWKLTRKANPIFTSANDDLFRV